MDFLKSIPHKFKPEQVALIQKAYDFAGKAHMGQVRKSGEDFVEHPIQAAIILGHIFPDTSSIVATLLHDITEDTTTTHEQLVAEFGEEIADLVDGVTKLGHVRLRNSKDEFYVENLRKMFIATSKDIRVMLIKLADRLHNMRTIEALAPDKQLKIATETQEMYAPIASRLGIGTWKDELEDLAFKIVSPDDYKKIDVLLSDELKARSTDIKEMEKKISSILRREGIKFIDITGRSKRLYSLFKKLKKYDGDISKIYDIIAFRIMTKSTADGYAAVGIIHKHFQPVPGRVKDFIAIPKPNGYQSIHTSVFDSTGHVFELQFRTDLMHEAAERGVAAHWFYEERGKSDVIERQTTWFQELRSWQEETASNPDEFLETLRIDFFKDRIFVLTPQGDVRDLPVGATAIDFAFSIHSDLGYYMMGAKVNGKMRTIRAELKQGDVVEILKTKKAVTVSRDWMDAAKTSHARGQIRAYLREHDTGILTRIRQLKLKDSLPKFFRKK